MKNITYQLLPLTIHQQRGVVNVGKCNLCTRFFIKTSEEIFPVEYATHVYSFNCSSFMFFPLFGQVKTSDVWLNVHYKTRDFINA